MGDEEDGQENKVDKHFREVLVIARTHFEQCFVLGIWIIVF